MAHFAKLDDNNLVTDIVFVDNTLDPTSTSSNQMKCVGQLSIKI